METQFVKQKYWFRLVLGQKHQCQNEGHVYNKTEVLTENRTWKNDTG